MDTRSLEEAVIFPSPQVHTKFRQWWHATDTRQYSLGSWPGGCSLYFQHRSHTLPNLPQARGIPYAENYPHTPSQDGQHLRTYAKHPFFDGITEQCLVPGTLIMHGLNERFRFIQATSPELKRAIYQLRHQVYVEEYGFEHPEDHPDGLEMDAYEPHSISLAVLDDTDMVIGTVRLVLHSPQGFPIEHAVPHLDFIGDKPAPCYIAEISRLAISPAYRRRIEDGFYGVESYLRQEEGGVLADYKARRQQYERRKRPVIVLGLYRLLYQVSKRLGLTHWYMISEKKLWYTLRKYQIVFHQIGTPVDYHGVRIPYLGNIAEIEAHLQRSNPAFLQSYLVGLEPEYHPPMLSQAHCSSAALG